MKKLVFVMTLALATSAFAQPKTKKAPPPPPPPQPVHAQVYSSAPSTKVFGANFGARQGAFNLGVAIDSGSNTGDLGGSFFLQTEKKEDSVIIVNQVMSFGAHVVLNIFDNNGWVVDLRPGVNITMINDVAKAGGGKDDKTVFGPSLRWSASHRLASGSEIGIERLEVWNWFEKGVTEQEAYTTLVFRTRF
ncbi:hypothetical protein CIK05_09360 [Bdellovibrio sp. qaytius]|nr:hypothetical protein CIK05_09360 [Bdellovibrio sp. qaytius]